MSKAAAITKLNERELELGIAGTDASWHQEYFASSTIYIGGLATTHTEKNILSIFEQYGTLIHVNLVRDPHTNKSKQYAFAIYADARSAVLAVDNLNAFEIDGSTLTVDHVNDYRTPQPPEAFDTTPASFSVADTHSGTPTDDSVAYPYTSTSGYHNLRHSEAERKRELAVMARLEKLRKRRRIGVTTSDDQPVIPTDAQNISSLPPQDARTSSPDGAIRTNNTSRDERRQRRIEKERRRAHRAAVRQARADRRAQRERQDR